MGPVGFEPTTKGFTLPRRFRREWTISSPVHQAKPPTKFRWPGQVSPPQAARCEISREPHLVRVGAGCSSLLSRALEPSGSLCTFRRCTGGSAQGCHGAQAAEGFPEFIPSTSRVSVRRHLVDESPALTAVLQAQRAAIVAAHVALRSETVCGAGCARGSHDVRRPHRASPGTRRSHPPCDDPRPRVLRAPVMGRWRPRAVHALSGLPSSASPNVRERRCLVCPGTRSAGARRCRRSR